MFKKTAVSAFILIFLVILSACSSINLPGLSATGAASATSTLQNKLGVGILELQGTSNAVTAAQAAALLPLWKAVKTQSSGQTMSTAEVNALYKQIEDTLTANQRAAIQQMTFTSADLTALQQKYGAQSSAGATASRSSTSGSTSSNKQAAVAGLGQNNGGIPGVDLGSITGSTGQVASSSSTSSSTTAKTAQTSTHTTNLNGLFASSVITLLEKSASA